MGLTSVPNVLLSGPGPGQEVGELNLLGALRCFRMLLFFSDPYCFCSETGSFPSRGCVAAQ